MNYMKKTDVSLITFGDIKLCKESWKNKSYCQQIKDKFDYHGIEKALCGKAGYSIHDMFIPKRIVVIQMM